MGFKLKPYTPDKPVPGANLEGVTSHCYPNVCSFVGKGHRVDNNVKASLTFCAPIMRQMATSSIIAPSTASTVFTPTNTVTDTHPKVRLAFGVLHNHPKHKLRQNV
jgi:hypothetical protein